MIRQSISLFVAFAVMLFGLDPGVSAQFAPAPAQYGQPSGQQPPPQPSYPGQNPSDPNAQAGQDGPTPEDVAADQQHGVVRLSVVQGDVNVKRGDNGEMTAAVTNAPLAARDRVQTSPGSRAEIELDSGNLVRVAPNTDIGFAALEYHRYQLQLGAGTIIYRVLRDAGSSVEIDTPSIAVRPNGQAAIRISVLEDGTTEITARTGMADVFSPRGSQQLSPGQTMLVRGNPSDPESQSVAEVGRDQLDDWSEHRDEDMMRSQSYRYVNPDVNGAQDLDQYGNWVPSQYGNVWTPRGVDANWSPYSTGHWVWVDYYGWSWVDDAPWGWAPYHYGRWFWNGGYGWSWWPGAMRGPSYWRPALVGFFGFGAGLALGALAGIGWVALAPFELFHPWWGHGGFGYGSRGYGYDRFGYRGNLAGMYRNAAIRGGAMTAAYGQFGTHGARFNVATRQQLAGASLFRGQVPMRPTAASYRFSDRQVHVNSRLASAGNRSFFQHQQFGAGGMSRSGQQAGFGGGQRGFGTSSGAAAAPRNERPAGGSGGASGWQRFGDSSRSGYTRQGFVGNYGDRSGWHAFGQAHGTTPGNNGNAAGRPSGGNTRSFGSSQGQAPRSSPSQSQPYGGSYGSRGSYGGGSYRAPQSGGSSYGGAANRGWSGSGGSAPHYSAPSYGGGGGQSSQPRMSAPRSSGGGSSYRGGGGGSSSHGGGGGGHSSGGGGGRNR